MCRFAEYKQNTRWGIYCRYLNAEEKNYMNLVIKGNALERRSEEAQTELKKNTGSFRNSRRRKKRNKWLLTKHTCWDLLLFFIKQSWYYVLITTEPYIFIYVDKDFIHRLVFSTFFSILLDFYVLNLLACHMKWNICCY